MVELHHLGNSPDFKDDEFPHDKFEKVEEYLKRSTNASIVLNFLYKKETTPTDLSNAIELEYGRKLIYSGNVVNYCSNLEDLGMLEISGKGLDSKYRLTDKAIEFKLCFYNKFGNFI